MSFSQDLKVLNLSAGGNLRKISHDPRQGFKVQLFISDLFFKKEEEVEKQKEVNPVQLF